MRDFVIFGASGDLAKNKLYPALWENYQQGCICYYFGYGRSEFSNQRFRQLIRSSVPQADDEFINKFKYIPGNYDKDGLSLLASEVNNNNAIYYLALPTRLEIIKDLINGLKSNNLIGKKSIVVLEKPFGQDLLSAKKLISFLDKQLGSDKTYLIDHYLAKDLVRNLITLRFANPIFENLWSNQFIEKIEIKAEESLGIEGRAQYYEKAGAIKDMVQNHVLQVLSLVTMDQPQSLDVDSFHQEKIKVLKDLQMFNNSFKNNIDIGQYKGYCQEKGVSPDSLTETFVEMNLEVNNPRWQGVRIDIKTGKKLDKKETEVIVHFKGDNTCLWQGSCSQLAKNKLIINLFPRGDIRLQVNTEVNPVKSLPKAEDLVFDFYKNGNVSLPYANALKDIYKNDRLYSPCFEEVILSWQFIDQIENWLKGKRKNILKKY